MSDLTIGRPGSFLPWILAGAALAVVTLASGGALGAQEITVVDGRVVEGRSGDPMQDVAVRLVTLDGREILGSSATDREGVYRIALTTDPAELPDSAMVESAAMGYGAALSEPFALRPGGTVTVPDLALQPDPMLLDTIQVQMRRHWSYIPPPRERVLQRQLLGKGAFVAGATLENADELHLAHALENRVEGLRAGVGPRGEAIIQSVRGSRCLILLVNQWPSSADDLDYHYRRGNIGALEIYRDFSEVPEDLHQFVLDTQPPEDLWGRAENRRAAEEDQRALEEDPIAWSGAGEAVGLSAGSERVPFCGLVNAWLWGDWNRGVTPP